MSGLSALLSLDTGTLDAKIELAGAGGSVSVSITDPLDLLGETGTLIRSIGDIVESGDDLPGQIEAAFGVLAEIAPFADLTIVTEVIEILGALKARLAPLRDLMDLDPAAMVEQAMQAGGGMSALVDQLVAQVTDTLTAELPEVIAVPMAALRDLGEGLSNDPAQIAEFFSRFVLGLDLATIRSPFDLLDAVRAQIAGGADTAALEARIVAVTLQVDLAADALLGPAPDPAAVLAMLAAVRTEIDLLTGDVLPDALDALVADIGAVDVAGLIDQLDAALAPLLEHVPVPPQSIGDFFLPPLRTIDNGIDALSSAMITQVLAEIEADIRDKFADSGITSLRDDVTTLLSGIVAFLDGLPLPALRDKLTQALIAIEGKAGAIGDFSPVGDIAAKMQEVATAIEDFDTSAVTDRIAQLADEVRAFTDQFPIGEIRDALAGLLDAANGLVADLPPLIRDLKAQIDGLAQALTSIDLSAAGEASVGVVQDLRAKVNEALASADLPDALKVPLGLIAGEVREIDLTASIDAPLAELVAKIDIAGAMAPVQGAIDQARAALQKLSPTALAQQLDAPFEAVLDKLEDFGPAAIIGKLSEAFQTALVELDRLDPVALVQPLQDAFDGILAQARTAADPGVLLAPLALAYAELLALLDAIDPATLLGRAVGEVSKLPGTLAGATGSALAAKLDPATLAPEGAIGGAFQFGDVLRPFAALVAQARAAVRSGAADLLDEGLQFVSQPLALLARAGQMAGGHVIDIADAIQARRALLDPNATSGPMADLRHALARLARIEAGLAAGQGSIALHGAVGSVQLDVYATIAVPRCHALDTATGDLTGGLRTDRLGRSMSALGNVIASFVPPALALPDTKAAILERIDALFDAIDPTPIADEMDAIGQHVLAKFQSFASEIAAGLFRIWNAIFEEMLPVLPQGLLPVLGEVFDAIRTQLATLDPARLEAELNELLDVVFGQLAAYSPAAFAGTLSSSFEALKRRLGELDPKMLLGDLDPLGDVIADLRTLKPSVVLAPLTAQAEQVDAALTELLDFDPAAIVIAAIQNLKAQIEFVLHGIEEELDGLLGDLEGAGGGGAVSIGA